MSDRDSRSTTVVSSNGGGGIYFVVGALVVAVLIGAYVLIGMPGLRSQVASAPGQPTTQKVDITVQQPARPAAPATPAPAAPAAPSK